MENLKFNKDSRNLNQIDFDQNSHFYVNSANREIQLEEIKDLLENLHKFELFAICQSFCQKDTASLLDVNCFMKNLEDNDRLKYIYYLYQRCLPSLRENALKKICNNIMKRHSISYKKKRSAQTEISHLKFKTLIDDYLAYDIHEDIQALFEEHLLACDSCSEFFLLNRNIVDIIKKSGNYILFNALVKDMDPSVEDKPIHDNVFISMCIKDYFEKKGYQVIKAMDKMSNMDHGDVIDFEQLHSMDVTDILRKYGKHLFNENSPEPYNAETILNYENSCRKDILEKRPFKEKDSKNCENLILLLPLLNLSIRLLVLNLARTSQFIRLFETFIRVV